MSDKVKIELEEPPEPNFGRFKTSTASSSETDPGDDDEIRKSKERGRAARRRAKVKREAAETPEFDVEMCGPMNEYILAVAGVITHREIQVSDAQKKTLDGCLVKIANRYAGWLAEYGSEILYGVTMFIIIKQSPKMNIEEEGVKAGDAQAEQNRVDIGP